ncbi:Histidinol-phosphate aminotransferase [Acaryochloris thomasi RCC1774]|uniref:Histidinol-phosphate aminotransferase n=1 Tax=Acaryochloris thomasi RCC1774 TaxID=1764569 RepID=A0A2W1JNY7_9CYAN|nr:histidinol-phosphate transaminase [Acaryochloris thomasi]PZD70961.1 Histidinol-phosphate aminotransferase [Acaryochloris thomasi RCC1774]
MTPFLRPHLQTIPGYTPGEQPPPGSTVIKLNTNENPYPPSDRVFEALQNIDGELLRRYPDASARMFREAAGTVFDISPDWITVANGSDDLLSIIMRAFVDANSKVVYPMPTYVLYRTLAQLQGVQPCEIPYDESFNLPISQLATADGAVTLVASPNSPSGTAIPIEQLEKLAVQVSGVLVIDEAYVDFAESSALALVRDHDHVIVLRTLSKGYSLAGLRLGFAIANPQIIQDLNKVKDSYCVDAIATLLGTAAIQDQDHKNRNAERVKRSRGTLAHDLEQLGFRVWPSQTNFLLIQHPDAKALELQQWLKQRNILVRHFNLPSVVDKLRITVGTDEQNAVLCQHFTHYLSALKSS